MEPVDPRQAENKWHGVNLVHHRSPSFFLVKLAKGFSKWGVGILLALIRFYQRFISPGLRPCCRFVPSCSEYASESLRKYGVLRGVGRSVWRVARCHPLGKGGLDEP